MRAYYYEELMACDKASATSFGSGTKAWKNPTTFPIPMCSPKKTVDDLRPLPNNSAK